MLKKKNIIIIFIFLTLLYSCGFKKINTNESLINLQNITIAGENRISYLLKSDLQLISNESAQNKYNVDVKLIKSKASKIKDKTGKTTRFTVIIDANLILKNNYGQEVGGKAFSRNGDYDVNSSHSKTINNEKSAIKSVVQKISEDIKNFIIITDRN
jgi:hypothetical protein